MTAQHSTEDVDGRGRSISTAILYDVWNAMRSLEPGDEFSGFARRGLARAGHPPPREKLAQLRELGARIYVCGPSMEHFKVSEEDLLFTDLRVAAYPTFAEEMMAAQVQIFLQ